MKRITPEHITQQGRKLLGFTREVLAITDQQELSRAVSRLLGEVLSASHAELLLADPAAGLFRSPANPSRTVRSSLLPAQKEDGEAEFLEPADLLRRCSRQERRVLDDVRGGCLVAVPGGGSPSALLIVGPARARKPYTPGQREFLLALVCGVALAVERNALVVQMRTEQSRISKMEKLASLGRLTAGIAHEFRNPLNIISTSAQTILRNPDNVALHLETGGYILEETERLTRTVDEFLQFAKPHTPVWEQVRIGDVFAGALQGLGEYARARQVEMKSEIDPSVSRITTSPQHIERVLRNLGLNAIEAMAPGGTLTMGAFPRDSASVTITVSDNGPGIPPEHHARLFDPFFTTKPNGTGLGLAIVFMLVQAVRGGITFTSSPRGTTFRIALPVDGSQQ